MARKATKNTKDKIVEKALNLAAEQGWAEFSMADIGKAMKLSSAELQEYFEDKDDILVAFGRMIDRQVLKNIDDPDIEVPPRERLFDILMERFEALSEYRSGLVSVLSFFRADPKQAVISTPHLCRSMARMLELAGIDATGMSGAVKVAGLTGIYLKTLRVWKDDESKDLAKTMAALDKDLMRADRLAGTFGF